MDEREKANEILNDFANVQIKVLPKVENEFVELPAQVRTKGYEEVGIDPPEEKTRMGCIHFGCNDNYNGKCDNVGGFEGCPDCTLEEMEE